MLRYLFKLREEEILKAYETFPEGFEIVENKPSGEYVIAVYTEEELKSFPFHLMGKEEVVYRDWREYYKPVVISDKTVVIPPWKVANSELADKTVLIINPGKAFGTGLHESTQLTLLLMEEEDLRGKSVLDIGCGSGILSIFAAKKGAKRVLAIDIDPLAVEETLENAKLNKVAKVVKAKKGEPKDIDGTYDLVVANLELPIFEKVFKDITPKIGEIAIFSGIYRLGELIDFLQLLEQRKLKPTKIVEKNGWYALRVVKNL
ncbi:MAG TPA: methyltransferase domain-containing protein [Aquifex aeolicus]|uniref:Methyltransferase domain-containing protein n=1 Tax=Aquifex aeolicus TaxID=63363 RepID=A0A9D0YR29_AQUAO|nr:methyltransferase domain-containing protein [Aquificales bacterium]HIP86694.1 methyltransferase domain-containing protein [Aquifex sp.]HIP98615.1 methyltransferase domain-containing protein [Aquifex aeolicus]HIQ26091.1 methyltransferase domain-containing protein [Aquifex aeolicus]